MRRKDLVAPFLAFLLVLACPVLAVSEAPYPLLLAGGRTRVFLAHGRKDEAIGLESSRKARRRLERLGFDVVLHEFDGGHTLPPELLQEAQRWIAATEKAAR